MKVHCLINLKCVEVGFEQIIIDRKYRVHCTSGNYTPLV